MRTIKLALILAILALLFVATGSLAVSAPRSGTWYVAPPAAGNDSNDCATTTTPCATINAALNKPGLVAGDTIRVAVGTYTGTGSEVVLLNKDATLSGGWDATFTTQTGMSTIDGQGARRGITIGGASTIEHFIIQNGYSLDGGGILNLSTTRIVKSIIRNNTAGELGICGGGGGGIESYALLQVDDSAIYGNTVFPCAGAAAIQVWRGELFLNNVTVSGNRGNSAIDIFFVDYGSYLVSINNSTISNNEYNGLRSANANAYLQNTIIANNGVASHYWDCVGESVQGGVVTSLGYNLIGTSLSCNTTATDLVGVDAYLEPLQDNGGLTFTHALQLASPAINAGNPSGCMGSNGILLTDQRGFPRVGRCDIGAYELQPIGFSTKGVNETTIGTNNTLNYTITLTNNGATNVTNILVTDTLPSYISFVPGSLTATSGNVSYGSGTITWNGAITAGQNAIITFGSTVNTSTPVGTSIANSAVIDSGEEIMTRTVTSTVVSHFDSANKNVNRSNTLPGDSLTFTIAFKISNLVGTTTTHVTDAIPNYLTFINGSLSASSGNATYNNGVITWDGSVNAGQSVTITFGADVSPAAPLGTLTNSAVINGGGEILTRTTTVTVSSQIFIPAVQKNQTLTGIAGVVTQNGSPVGGIPLQLRFYNGSSWSTLASTTTDPNGYFDFMGVPSLAPGQGYYVRYSNSGTTGRLALWQTRVLTSYTSGNYVEIGRFDLADITLTAPSPGATVALPYTFQWNRRTATPSDSYEFDLFDPYTGSPWWYTAPLGYVGNYTLTGLPSGFSTGTQYCWAVGVYSPDGGYGMSYYCYFVTFSNRGSKPAPQAPAKPRSAFSDLPRQQFIHKRP